MKTSNWLVMLATCLLMAFVTGEVGFYYGLRVHEGVHAKEMVVQSLLRSVGISSNNLTSKKGEQVVEKKQKEVVTPPPKETVSSVSLILQREELEKRSDKLFKEWSALGRLVEAVKQKLSSENDEAKKAELAIELLKREKIMDAKWDEFMDCSNLLWEVRGKVEAIQKNND